MTDALRATLTALGGTRICNQYGPSETHVVSQQVIGLDTAKRVPVDAPIGSPIANTTLRVLDSALTPVPTGVAGELYIGGPGLAQGYLNRHDLTAARFIDDPFADRPGARLFRSGDLVRRDADGVLHFLGRIDDQVKIRGYRVEPGEVESVLRAQEGVRDAAVIVRDKPAGQLALVAYCVTGVPVAALRDTLAALLPSYMCPQEIVVLDRLPLNTSGKVDRRALPDPDWQTAQDFVAPVTPTETTLCEIWSRTLGVPRIGALDDFFANGGHSLLAARILHLINAELGCDLGLSTLLGNPVLRDLARQIDRCAPSAAPSPAPQITADPENRHAPFPLTDIQQAYLVGRDESLSLGGVSAHSYTELRIAEFDVLRFEAALNAVIARHDMLRAVFAPDGTQRVLADVPAYRIAVHSVTDPSQAAARAALDAQRARLSHQVLDAQTWPLFGFEVTALPDGNSHLHISLDALIVDAASTSLLMTELVGLYEDPNLDLDAPGVTFRDYVLADRALRASESYAKAMAYWMDRFEDLPTGPDLPLLCQPDSIEKPVFHRQDHCIEKPVWNAIKDNAGRHKVTASGMLLAAFCTVLGRYAQNRDFSLSLPLFNRQPLHPDINAVIGDFSSVLLFRSHLDAGGTFAEYATAVQAALWQDMDHTQVSGIEVMRALARRADQPPQGLPVVFNSTLTELQTPAPARAADRQFRATNVHTITQTPQVWLDHTIIEEDGALFFNWDSIDGLFPPGMVEDMFAAYCDLLEALARPAFWSEAGQSVFPAAPDVPTLPQAGATLDALFVGQAGRTPDRDAIITSARRLSYETLLTEAQTLAARLQEAGVRRGDRVAVLMPVRWEQTVAVLGCLMAGGAYVPIDADFPDARVTALLTRTRASVVVTSPATPRVPSGTSVPVIEVLPYPAPRTPAPVAVSDTDLAYVIFTSGSTGEPKGVMIDHGGATNTLHDINARIGLTAQDRILGVSALNFDLSVYDIFGPLSVGAALVLPDAEKRRDPVHWRALIRAHDVTIWNAVPALSGLLVEDWQATDDPLPLRCAMMSGDWIPLALPGALRRAAPEITIWSLGGATEASIWSIGYPVTEVPDDWTSIPYGTALEGQSVHVLDHRLAPRPPHVAGEIYIGGRGLALGYWEDPERTQDAFVNHPVTGARLYRTGDLGRAMPDGTIEFLGRRDSQVKLQGYRIELGGIEKALERHPGVTAAAVRIVGAAMAQKRLAAYVVGARDAVRGADLRDHLAGILPSYEIPSSFTWLDALPLSANGKVDRAKLPDPVDSGSLSDTAFTIGGSVERDIAGIVLRTLGQEKIDPHANLLSLGASSLDIVRISNAVAAAHGFRPPLARFMRSPTLAALITLWRDSAAVQEAPPSQGAPDPSDGNTIEDETARAAFKAAQKGLREIDGPRARLPFSAHPPRKTDLSQTGPCAILRTRRSLCHNFRICSRP
ncbi:amino acid adenylation domain-containing protein [Sulfitobacter albidus]|uniref:Amino acid adenylation domain-containing protein n=1 Tax=Sulfitobacter albidus TaxID=2829501 RepID=A0A975PMU8_9RHOB|nr:non-ribosomal peptide synthetase [Sulfitobacter albidus]QUJ76791.1 amino acid adenylation domain-containing protein [Sulfitobacter albidus]